MSNKEYQIRNQNYKDKKILFTNNNTYIPSEKKKKEKKKPYLHFSSYFKQIIFYNMTNKPQSKTNLSLN